MNIKIGILGDASDPAVAELVEALQRRMPDIEIVCADRISEHEISVGYRIDASEVDRLAGDVALAHGKLMRGRRLTAADFSQLQKNIDWPAEAISHKQQESWQGKRRTPWRKRR